MKHQALISLKYKSEKKISVVCCNFYLVHYGLNTIPVFTVIFLNIKTARYKQTLQALIRLLFQEQFTQGLHSLPFHLYLLDTYCIVNRNVSFL